MKTILFPVFQGVVSRNILRTDFLKYLLARSGVEIIILVSSLEKKEYFSKEFKYPRVTFAIASKYEAPHLSGLFRFLKYGLLNTKRMDIRRRIYLNETNNHFVFLIKFIFNRIFARRFFRRIVRFFDYVLIDDRNYLDVFHKYKPDLLISAHPFSDEETSMLKQSRKIGIRSVGIINSWDKMTSRSILRILPDKILVHNGIVKKEVIDYADMPQEDIEIIGVPHYDIFFNSKPRSKEYFFSRFSIDLSKKILLFCPTGQVYSNSDVDILNTLVRLNTELRFGQKMKIIVRFPPNDIVDFGSLLNNDDIVFYQPGIRFSAKRGIDWDMNEEDNQLLFDMLYWSSIIICPPSSLSIDASVLDRPVVNIKFGEYKKYASNNVNLYYDSDHYLHILKHNGISVVHNEDQLVEAVCTYLKDPNYLAEGRKKIAMEQCPRVDGKSAKRLADKILNML